MLLLLLGSVMGLILWSHSRPDPEPLWLAAVEIAISLTAPIVLLAFVERASARPVPVGAAAGGRMAAWSLPLAWVAYVRLVALVASWRGPPPRLWVPPIEVVVAYQVAFTLRSAAVAWSERAVIDAEEFALRWARRAVAFIAVVHLAQVVRFFVEAGPLRNVVPVTSALVVVALTFIAVRETGFFSAQPPGRAAGRAESAKDASAALAAEQAEEGLRRFERGVGGERLYRDPELTLDRVAERIGVGRTYLSQLINERRGSTFPEVLAEYRVAEARRLLGDQRLDQLTVEAIGERAGFQSKSAFYSAFKRLEGSTPAAYRRRLSPDAPVHPAPPAR